MEKYIKSAVNSGSMESTGNIPGLVEAAAFVAGFLADDRAPHVERLKSLTPRKSVK